MNPPLAAIVLCGVLSGCAGGAALELASEPAAGAARHTIHVATSRQRSRDKADFGAERSQVLSYGGYTVSVPPTHKTGKIELSRGKPNAKTDFVTLDARDYGSLKGLSAAINAGAAELAASERDAVVFVHGYNTNFAEGLYRFAQMKHDFQMPGLAVHYSWPSSGKAGKYAYDRDSALFARDGLQRLLHELAESKVQRITLVGHSLGSYLVMETLRQMQIAGERRFKSKLNGVILLSPDIDLDVFKTQAEHLKPLPDPFTIFVSTKDRALSLSGWIAGEPRLGSLSRASELDGLKVNIIDISNFADGDMLNHTTALSSPALISILRGLPENYAIVSSRRRRVTVPIRRGVNIVAENGLIIHDLR